MKKMILLNIIIIIVFGFSSLTLYGQQTKFDGIISEFINNIKTDDSKSIAERMYFPFHRRYPIPSIKSSKEFIERYDEVVDDSLKKLIIDSDIRKDWIEVGWRGIMLYRGILWLDTEGHLFRINYESQTEKEKRRILINQDKDSLYDSLKDFVEPMLLWETKTYRIRIDEMDGNNYRFASWKISKSQKDRPDIVLLNGEIILDGMGGNCYVKFKNGSYDYQCYVRILGKRDDPPGELIVSKDEHEILRESVIRELNK